MGRVITTGRAAIGVDETGTGDAVPILFLHGVGSDKSVWAPQLAQFGAKRRTVAFDYPGYGESDPADSGTTRDDFAAAILGAMETLGIERAHVCGLSLGGVIAIAMYAAAPTRCVSLILADSFAVHPDGAAIHERATNASRTLTMKQLAEQRTPAILAAGASQEIRDEVCRSMARIDPDAFRIGTEAVWLADQRDRVAEIAVPTLVLVGDQDTVTPPALSEELANAIPGARLQIFAGAGHLTNIERPDEFNAVVETFIHGVEALG
jgi:3-oxoadipate enol-lactonase